MKRIVIGVSMAGALCAITAQAAFDGTLKINGGAYQNSNGGEFSALSTGLGNFQTFCLEDAELLQLGNGANYNYWKNSGAVTGNPNQLAPPTVWDGHPTSLTMDPVSLGTAWLYSQFRANTLVDAGGISYFNANRNAHAGVLQQAIWGLEGEVAYNPLNTYIMRAKAVLGKTDAQLQADSLGAYGVIALNLYDGYTGSPVVTFNDGTRHYLNQDVLAVVPEPSTIIAGALLLLPFGASTLRMFRRRSRE